MKYNGIVLSDNEPNKDVLWIKDGVMKYFNNGKWNNLSGGSSELESPSNNTPVVYLYDVGSEVNIYPGIMYEASTSVNTKFILYDKLFMQEVGEQSDIVEEFMLRLKLYNNSKPSFVYKRYAHVLMEDVEVESTASITGNFEGSGRYDVSIVNGSAIVVKLDE